MTAVFDGGVKGKMEYEGIERVSSRHMCHMSPLFRAANISLNDGDNTLVFYNEMISLFFA